MAHLNPIDYDNIINLEDDDKKTPLKTPAHLQQHIDVFNVEAGRKDKSPVSLPELSDGESITSHPRSRGSVDSTLSEPSLATPEPLNKKISYVGPDDLLHFSNQPACKLDKIVRAPYEYIAGLPQKSFRTALLHACNAWYNVPEDQCAIIARVIGMLHNASLMIDDIQDGSDLRRGQPVAHSIFGIAQTINSANLIYFQAQAELSKLPNWQNAVKAFEEELICLHRGQGMELYWRDTFTLPKMDQYLQMISDKTGGLFRLIAKLLHSCTPCVNFDLIPLVETVGLMFQILDDCKNLLDHQMAEHKGFCEDLSEGKFSFPIVHALSVSSENSELLNILKSRPTDIAIKAYVVRHLQEETGSFAFAKRMLEQIHQQARCLLENLNNPEARKCFETVLDKLVEHERKAFSKDVDGQVP